MSDPINLPPIKKVLEKIKGKYYLQEWETRIPVCHGCFNEFGDCGTPCIDCERYKAWTDEWVDDLMVNGKYVVYRRKRK